jgi:hypothetical protein
VSRKQYKIRTNYDAFDSFIIKGQFECVAMKEEEDDDENDEDNKEKDGDKVAIELFLDEIPLYKI